MATGTVRLHRVLRASPERVYRAFLDADAMAKWIPPYGFTCKVHHMDARVGGTYQMSFTNFSTGHDLSFGGQYLELVPFGKLRYTDKFDDPNLPGEIQVTVTLKQVSCGTELNIVQEGLPEVIPLEMCYLGWQESLAQLANLVEPEIPGDEVKIEVDDLSRPAVHALLNEHLQNMYELSPPESVHALDLDKLRKPDITFWTAWDGPLLLGCGALKELSRKHGEIKSMRTPKTGRRKGVGRAILTHIIAVARSRSYQRLSLETGSVEAFIPAQKLYESFGFSYCGPFGEYIEDPNSVFMTLRL